MISLTKEGESLKNPFAPLIDRWWKAYRKASIQMVISVSFTAVAAIGMIFLGLALFVRFSVSNNTQTTENTQRVLSQVNLNIDTYLRNMMRVSDTLYYHVIKSADLSTSEVNTAMDLLYESNRSSIVSVALFSEDGTLVTATPLSTLKDSVSPEEQDWFTAATDRIENLHFSTPHVQNLFDDPDYNYQWVVSLSRHVELTQDGTTQDGVLLVDMSFDGIEQLCKDVELSSSGYLYIVDGDGELIYHPRQQLIYAGLLEENSAVAATYSDGSHSEVFQGTSRQVTVETVGYTGWKLVSVVPMEHPWSNYSQLFLFVLFLILFSVFLLVFVNLYLSARISVPIKKLDQFVKEMERGHDTQDMTLSGPHEIEHLSHSIQSMVSTLHHLMDDIIQQEERKRRSELDVLHSQINPHFLYNTLDSVVWMTENGRTEESILMVTSLARLFRISLSRGYTIIPIADEFAHAHHYLTIQKMRYKNKFTATIQTDPSAEGLYTLKLIVQPILENAIYHGMSYADDDGEITIHTFREGEDILIDITDNGPGMTPAQASRLLEQNYVSPSTQGSGIGLRNVHQRLRLTFGEAYGLTIQSEPDAGTTVRIRLPALTEEQAAIYQKEGNLS